VSSCVPNAIESSFDPDKPYFAVWRRLYDIDVNLSTSPLFFFAPDANAKLDAGPLYYAALCGFTGLVEKLIVKHPHLVSATGGYYRTPALAALARRHLELVRMLHRKGSSMDLRGRDQHSPLHSAALQGDIEIVKVLLDCKLGINAKRGDGQTPLHFALRNWPPNYFETIRLLLEKVADPRARKSDGTTPLHLASSMEEVEVVRLLLRHGADVEAEGDYGRTAFDVASERGVAAEPGSAVSGSEGLASSTRQSFPGPGRPLH
jgi:ankyrin repeat protein